MRIKKLRISQGYKRFHDLTIDLGESPARIVALVGPNGCGKSSVLDAMLYRSQNYRQIGSTSSQDVWYHLAPWLTTYAYSNIDIEFTSGFFDEVAGQRFVVDGTLFSFRSPYRHNSHLRVNETRATNGIEENNIGARDASSLDSRMEDNYRRLHAAFYRHMHEADVSPSAAARDIVGRLNRSISACLNLEITNLGVIEDGRGTIFFKKAGQPGEFSFNVLSAGEKEVVDLLLDLYLRSKNYTDTIFLIDEPELHINTAIQANLLAEIDGLIGENCQIWITTHSIGFIRALQNHGDCQIIHFRPDLQTASEVVTLRPVVPSPTVWRELFAVALHDLADLVSPETIIYCEGRADPGPGGLERGLDAKVLNAIFNEMRPQALLVSSGGNTELDQRSDIAIAIMGKVFPEVDIWVLKDRDMASGRATSEADRLRYLSLNNQNHRVLQRWEIENYLYDKDVLKSFCAARSFTFNETKYDAVVTNIVDQDVKKETAAIKAACGINFSISAEAFKLELAQHVKYAPKAYGELEATIFNRA